MGVSGTARKKLVIVLGLMIFVLATYRFSAVSNANMKPSATLVHQTSTTMLKAILHNDTPSSQVKQLSKIIIHSNIRHVDDKVEVSDLQPELAVLPAVSDHFIDWPSAFHKTGCQFNYPIRDRTFSFILYIRDVIDSLPVQTFLSVVQFSSQSRNPIREVVVTYVNESLSLTGYQAYIDEIQRLATISNIKVFTTSGSSEWKAKLNAIKLSSSEQVFVADDTVIMNRHFMPPLLYTLQEHPQSLVTPHADSLMPMRIYTMYDDKKIHPDAQIWQETTFGIHHVAHDMTMKRTERQKVHTLPTTMPTAGLTGEVFVATKSHLTHVLGEMKTDEVAELSLLSYMCGSGIIGNKCSVAVRTNAYWITAPETKEPETLQRLYPFYDTNPDKLAKNSCQDVKHYYNEIHRFLANL